MNIYILRHGETNGNKAGRIQGSTDIPLNENGIRLAEETAELQFDIIYASPLSRARKTAEIVRGTHTTEIVIDDRIVEMNFGKAEGMLIKDINEKPENQNLKYCFTIPSKYQAKDGAESYEHIMARAKDFLENELRPLEHTYENVLVVCHGALIRALLLNVLGWDIDRYWEIHQPNCCMNLVTLKDGKFNLAYMEKIYYEGDVAAKGIL